MNVDPQGVLKLVGIEAGPALPLVANCPLCGASSKLEVRSGLGVVCRSCWFVGDLIQLYARYTKLGTIQAIEALERRAVVGFVDGEISKYVTERMVQDVLKDVWLCGAKTLRQHGDAASVFGALSSINSRPSHQQLCRLVPHAIYLRREDLSERNVEPPDEGREAWSWWGRYSALAVPAWDGSDIAGFWLLTTKGSQYLPLVSGLTGVGFALIPSVLDPWTVLVDDFVHTLRLSIWAIRDTDVAPAFLCSAGIKDRSDSYKCRRTVYWSPAGNIAHYLRAVRTGSAQTILHTEIAYNPDTGTPLNGSVDLLSMHITSALPAHHAAAKCLLEADEEQAKAALINNGVDPADRARILAYVHGENNRYLSRLFDDASAVDQTVTWNGQTVVDTLQGWMCKGVLITNAKLYLEQVRPYGTDGEAMVTGTVLFVDVSGTKHSFGFSDRLSAMRKDTGDWLFRRVVAHTGKLPTIDSRWRSRLLDIAQNFHQPAALMLSKLYGWDGQVLRMPYFVLNARSMTATASAVDGPIIPLPGDLSAAEWSSMSNPAFCRMALALLGNLVRTARGSYGVGILLTNEAHVVERVANVFGAEVLVAPSDEVLDLCAQTPLPLFTTWVGKRLNDLFARLGPKNIVVNVDRNVARLATLSPEWLHVRINDALDYSALRVVFFLMQELLATRIPDPDTPDFYRDLAMAVQPYVERHTQGSRAAQAALELDQHFASRNSTFGSRILELIVYFVNAGEIIPEDVDGSVRIEHAQFKKATNSPYITLPSIRDLTEALQNGRFLTGVDDDAWLIGAQAWGILRSLAAMR